MKREVIERSQGICGQNGVRFVLTTRKKCGNCRKSTRYCVMRWKEAGEAGEAGESVKLAEASGSMEMEI